MGIFDKLRGNEMERQWRRHNREEAHKEAAQARLESEKSAYRDIMVAKARKEGREKARYEAEGGFFGAMGRFAIDKAKEYKRSARSGRGGKKVGFMSSLMPTTYGEGYASMPNVDNIMPDFAKKSKKRR